LPKIAEKQVVIDEIRAALKGATSVVMVDARGLSVEQDTALRKKMRTSEIYYKVFKNTLMDLAVNGTEFEPLKPIFKGPSTLAVSYKDATLAARIVGENIKTMPNLKFKGGLVEGTFYDEKGIATIANIPPRAELLSKLLGSLKSPISGLARVLTAVAEEKSK
jgi:large subunit ribosomal protein L10